MTKKVSRASGAVISGGAAVQAPLQQGQERDAIEALFQIVGLADFIAANKAELLTLGGEDSKRKERIESSIRYAGMTDNALRGDVLRLCCDRHDFSVPASFKKMDAPESSGDETLVSPKTASLTLAFLWGHPVIKLCMTNRTIIDGVPALRIGFTLLADEGRDAACSHATIFLETKTGEPVAFKGIAHSINEAAERVLDHYLTSLSKSQDSLIGLAVALNAVEKAIKARQDVQRSQISDVAAILNETVSDDLSAAAVDMSQRYYRKIKPKYQLSLV